jgi:hypothetical protein
VLELRHASGLDGLDAPIPGAHLIPENSASLPGLVLQIIKVDNATPATLPHLRSGLTIRLAIRSISVTSIRCAWCGPGRTPTTAPGRAESGSPKIPSHQDVRHRRCVRNTITNKIPAAAVGSYTISVEARNLVTLLPNTTKATTAINAAKSVRYYFSVDQSKMTPRRQVVSTVKCAACHSNVSFVHSGMRNDAQECTLCLIQRRWTALRTRASTLDGRFTSIHRGENL